MEWINWNITKAYLEIPNFKLDEDYITLTKTYSPMIIPTVEIGISSDKVCYVCEKIGHVSTYCYEKYHITGDRLYNSNED